MPKPKSPERPLKRKAAEPKAEPKTEPKAEPKIEAKVEPNARVATRAQALIPAAEDQFDEVPDVPSRVVDQLASVRPVYPVLIRELLSICMSEADDVKAAFKNRNRQRYKKIFSGYKEKLERASQKDYSIIKSALFYLYDFSRVNSIDKDTAVWLIGIYEIPTSQIVSYTSKEVLRSIAKDHGLSYSNKKAEELVENIRKIIDPSQ